MLDIDGWITHPRQGEEGRLGPGSGPEGRAEHWPLMKTT